MSENYTVAFGVYKQGVLDDDGLAKVAEVKVGFTGGLLGGLALDGILIKQHREKGLQVVFHTFFDCFTKKDEVESQILVAFAKAFTTALKKEVEPESRFDDFSGIPEPRGKFTN